MGVIVNMAFRREGAKYVALGYAATWLVSLALAIAGSIALLTGGLTSLTVIWLFTGCLVVFLSMVAIDVAYTFHRKKMALIAITAPEVAPVEAVEAVKTQKRS